MTLYLAGPMRGREQFNFPAFDLAATILRGLGYEVISPAEMDRDNGFDEKHDREDDEFLAKAFARNFKAIDRSDGIALLDEWQKSAGALLELEWAAEHRGLPVGTVKHWQRMAAYL